MTPVRTAAIVGVHWGLVHLRGLREAGCEVVALAASNATRAAEVAAREGVSRGTADLATLNDVDVVVVAVPAAAHAGVIAALPGPFLICEKPLLGLQGSPEDLPPTRGRMLVNYAFGHLATARIAAGAVARTAAPEHVEVAVEVALPADFTAVEWFLEAASHPLSWVLDMFGPPTVLSRTTTGTTVAIELLAGRVPISAALQIGTEPGIHQRISMDLRGCELAVRGRYRPGLPWEYDPVLLDGAPISDGEWSPTDCWLDANARSVAAMLGVFRGETPWSVGLASGLFDADKALMVEAVLLDPPQSG